MKFFKCFLIVVGVHLCLSSCMTPITDPAVLERLTTCRHGSLDRVKKNLLLMGYDVVQSGDETLSTDYKQDTAGYGGSKLFTKVNVVKVGPKLIKFKVRKRDVYKTQEADRAYVATQEVNRSRYGGKVSSQQGEAKIVSYKNVTESNDSDFVYYQEKEHEYRVFRDQVCGKNRYKGSR